MGGVTRTGLYKFGGVALGAMCGLQYGLWRMQSLYRRVDPDGTLRKELEGLYRQNRQGHQTSQDIRLGRPGQPGQSGQSGKSDGIADDPNTTFTTSTTDTTATTDTTKTNKYGDKLE